MGHNIKCGECGADVYTTGTRFPQHETPEGKPCKNSHTAREPIEYSIGMDSDPGVYNGGLPELGKNN
jgi:hypothetical protein